MCVYERIFHFWNEVMRRSGEMRKLLSPVVERSYNDVFRCFPLYESLPPMLEFFRILFSLVLSTDNCHFFPQ